MTALILILTLTLAFLLALPRASHAKGGGSSTHAATAPKSEELKALESQFYGLANMTMAPYTGQLDKYGQLAPQAPQTDAAQTPAVQTPAAAPSASAAVSAGKGAAPESVMRLNPDGSVSSDRVVSAASSPGSTVIPQPYDDGTLMGQLFNDATKKTYVANHQYDSLVQEAPKISGQISDLLGKGAGYVDQAGTAGDPWYGKAWDAYGTAEGLLGQMQNNLSYTSEANKWYDDYTRGMLGRSQSLLDTGQIPQPIMDAMLSSMTQGVSQSVGANVNDLAARGVLNSSVSNRALADASRSVSDSMNANYLNAFNTILSGTNQTAQTGADAGRAFADTRLNINNAYSDAMKSAVGLGDSYGKTGSQRVSDLLNVAAGYDSSAAGYGSLLDSNLAQRAALQGDISNYYVNAAAPMIPAYDLLKTMQQDHWNSDKQDTVVSSGK